MRSAVYDLCVARPHEPADVRYTAEEWRVYVEGYDTALRMALKVLDGAVTRFQLYRKTKRLERARAPRGE